MQARIQALRKEFEVEESEATCGIAQEQRREEVLRDDRNRMAKSRRADNGSGEPSAPVRGRKPQRSR